MRTAPENGAIFQNMLIRSSGVIEPGFCLLTLGGSCRYLLSLNTESSDFALLDPGCSAHVFFLERRLQALGFKLQDLQCIFLTHLHPDRMGGLPHLRQKCPASKVIASPLMQNKLADSEFIEALYIENCRLTEDLHLRAQVPSMPLDEYRSLLSVDICISDSDVIPVGKSYSLRAIHAPGHTAESLAYLVQPLNFLIADECLGYYQPRTLSAPGADESLAKALKTIERISRLDLAGLCFPSTGVLTGQLVRKHLSAIKQNMEDLQAETEKAFKAGLPAEQIRQSIAAAFYASDSSDVTIQHNLKRSLEAVWRQLAELSSVQHPESSSQ